MTGPRRAARRTPAPAYNPAFRTARLITEYATQLAAASDQNAAPRPGASRINKKVTFPSMKAKDSGSSVNAIPIPMNSDRKNTYCLVIFKALISLS